MLLNRMFTLHRWCRIRYIYVCQFLVLRYQYGYLFNPSVGYVRKARGLETQGLDFIICSATLLKVTSSREGRWVLSFSVLYFFTFNTGLPTWILFCTGIIQISFLKNINMAKLIPRNTVIIIRQVFVL